MKLFVLRLRCYDGLCCILTCDFADGKTRIRKFRECFVLL